MKNHSKNIVLLVGLASLLTLSQAKAAVITEWNFDNLASGSTDLTPAASSGVNTSTASAESIGMTAPGKTGANPVTGATGPDTSNINNEVGTDTDNKGSSNNTWRIVGTNGWSSTTPIGSQGAQFSTSTVGFNSITMSFDLEITSQGEANMQVEYTLNGTSWLNAPLTYTGGNGGSIASNSSDPNLVVGSYFHSDTSASSNLWFNDITATFAGASNDANFAVRIVNAATGSDDVALHNNAALNNSSGNWRLDDVQIDGTAAVPEPSTWALLLGGMAFLFHVARAHRRSVQG